MDIPVADVSSHEGEFLSDQLIYEGARIKEFLRHQGGSWCNCIAAPFEEGEEVVRVRCKCAVAVLGKGREFAQGSRRVESFQFRELLFGRHRVL